MLYHCSGTESSFRGWNSWSAGVKVEASSPSTSKTTLSGAEMRSFWRFFGKFLGRDGKIYDGYIEKMGYKNGINGSINGSI